MPKYVIERELLGAGKLSEEELQGISQTSCNVLNEMGPQIQWFSLARAVETRATVILPLGTDTARSEALAEPGGHEVGPDSLVVPTLPFSCSDKPYWRLMRLAADIRLAFMSVFNKVPTRCRVTSVHSSSAMSLGYSFRFAIQNAIASELEFITSSSRSSADALGRPEA